MTEHHDAVVLILDRLKAQGLEWYRSAKAEDVNLFERRISGSFSIFDGGEIHTVGRKPKGSLPAKKILVMPPSGREEEAILGLWLRWDFEAEPLEFWALSRAMVRNRGTEDLHSVPVRGARGRRGT